MKTPQNRIGISLGTLVLGGWMASAAMAFAQDAGPRPGPPQGPPQGPPPPQMDGAPRDVPQAMRMRMAMGRVAELRRAGKHDEAERLAQRLRAAAGERPQMAREGNVRQPQIRGRARVEQKSARPAAPAAPVAQARMKMQHLKQAAEHLQAAGYEEQAAKLRQEIGRIEEQARREAGPADSNAGLKEEMNKLRREIEELRQQNRRLKEAAAPKREPARPEGAREPVRRPNADGAPQHQPAPPHPEMHPQ